MSFICRYLKGDKDGSLENTTYYKYRTFIVRRENAVSNRYDAFRNYVEYLTYRQSVDNSFTHHEILCRRNFKMFFDIDCGSHISGEEYQTFMDILIDATIEEYASLFSIRLVPEDNIVVTGGSSIDKISNHIIIDKFYHSSILDLQFLFDKIIKHIPEKFKNILDAGVYTNNHCLRLLGETKQNTTRTKQFISTWNYHGNTIIWNPDVDRIEHENHIWYTKFAASTVTFTDMCKPLMTIRPIIAYSTPVDMTHNGNDAFELVRKLIPVKLRKIENNIVSFDKIQLYKCLICDRVHEHENPFLLVDAHGAVYYICRRDRTNRLLLGCIKKHESMLYKLKPLVGERRLSIVGRLMQKLTEEELSSSRKLKK